MLRWTNWPSLSLAFPLGQNLELNSWSKKSIMCANFFFIFFWLSRAIRENGGTSLEDLCSWVLFSRKWEIYSSSSGYAPKSLTVQRVIFIFIQTIFLKEMNCTIKCRLSIFILYNSVVNLFHWIDLYIFFKLKNRIKKSS